MVCATLTARTRHFGRRHTLAHLHFRKLALWAPHFWLNNILLAAHLNILCTNGHTLYLEHSLSMHSSTDFSGSTYLTLCNILCRTTLKHTFVCSQEVHHTLNCNLCRAINQCGGYLDYQNSPLYCNIEHC